MNRTRIAVTIAIGCFGARSAAAQSASPPSFPLEDKEPRLVIGRLGAGADSNVLRDPDASAHGLLLRGDIRGEWEPIADLRLIADGAFEGDVASTPSFIYETVAGLLATYRMTLIGDLALSIGSFSEYAREPSVFLAGRIIASGAALRTELSERLSPILSYAIGPIDLEAGARGELEHVEGLEEFDEVGIEAIGGVRWIVVPRFFSLRARYTYDRQIYRGLAARDLLGDVLPNGNGVRLGIHGVRASARFHPLSELTMSLHLDQEWIGDAAAGFLSGNRQRARAEVFLEAGPLTSEIAAELALRRYTQRAPIRETPVNGLDFTDPMSEATLDAWVDSDIRVTKVFGIYLRYQIQRVSANPPGLIFLRHAVTFGPSLRWSS
jgi:hypothetical protein